LTVFLRFFTVTIHAALGMLFIAGFAAAKQ